MENPMLKPVSAETASEMIRQGALLIDIREANERARAFIPGSGHLPPAQLRTGGLADARGRAVIFHCRSGMRTQANAAALLACADAAGAEFYMLDGGLEAWRKAGLPVEENRRAPIEIMRQVQITAGLLILSGVLLGWQVHEAFYGLSAFVGAGLTFAGISGSCMMARLLALMPWNRARTRTAA